MQFPPASKDASSSAASDPAKREVLVQSPLTNSGIAFQTQSAGNPWTPKDPEQMEEWEQCEAEMKEGMECRYCAYGPASMEFLCTWSNKAECIDLTTEHYPEVKIGPWIMRGSVAYLSKKYNNALELSWIWKFLTSKGLEALIMNHKVEGRQKVYVSKRQVCVARRPWQIYTSPTTVTNKEVGS